jgi:hypothetical protein
MVGVVHPVDGGQLLRHLQLLRLEVLQNAHTIQHTCTTAHGTRTYLQVLEEPFSVVARHLQGLPTNALG